MATRSHQSRKIIISLIAGSCGLLAVAYPDWRSEVRAQTYDSEFHSLLAEMEEGVRDIEVIVSQIESTGLIDERSLAIEGLFAQVGEAALEAYQIASEEVMRETEPEVVIESHPNNSDHGKRIEGTREPLESVPLLEELENQLLGHRRRVEGIIPRIAEIDAEIGTGDVIISNEILRELTREELDEFFSTLTPKARRVYREWLPPQHGAAPSPSLLEKFANVLMPQNVSQRREYCYDQLARYQSSASPSLLEKVANVLIPPAHAGLAVGCLAICKKSAGTLCFQCLGAAGVTVGVLATQLDECFDTCGRCRWFRPWACVCRGICVSSFLILVG